MLVALYAACLALWVGVPLLWLYLGSVIQTATDNVGAAIGGMILGVTVTIGLMLPLLAGITRAYQRARVSRGLDDTGSVPLEAAMTISAVLALAFIVIWFAFLGGATSLLFTG